MFRIFRKALALFVSGLFVSLLAPMSIPAQPALRFSTAAIDANRAITRLEFGSARKTLTRIQKDDPDNRVVDFLQYEMDFLQCILTEEAVVLDRFQRQAQGRIDRIGNVPESEVWRGTCLGEMYMMRGILAYKRQAYLQAASDIRRGYQATLEGLKRFPRFLPGRRDAAVLRILMGTVPDRYQWALEWISGIDGNIVLGMEELQDIRLTLENQGHFLATETGFLEAILRHYVLGHPDEALDLGASIFNREPGHPFLLFLMATLQQENGNNDVTIRLLSRRMHDPRQEAFPYLDYLSGKAYLYTLNMTAAEQAVEKFLASWKGTSLRADALQKMAWCALLQGYSADYSRIMGQVATLNRGQLDQDRQAYQDAIDGVIPHIDLLRARLLFDGGYLDRTARTLAGINVETFLQETDRIEYDYRRGRVAQEQSQFEEAMTYFTRCWEAGRAFSIHYACASALQAGNLCLEQHRGPEARMWYNRCLDLNPDRYRDGLHQKAKAGLLQVKP